MPPRVLPNRVEQAAVLSVPSTLLMPWRPHFHSFARVLGGHLDPPVLPVSSRELMLADCYVNLTSLTAIRLEVLKENQDEGELLENDNDSEFCTEGYTGILCS